MKFGLIFSSLVLASSLASAKSLCEKQAESVAQALYDANEMTMGKGLLSFEGMTEDAKLHTQVYSFRNADAHIKVTTSPWSADGSSCLVTSASLKLD